MTRQVSLATRQSSKNLESHYNSYIELLSDDLRYDVNMFFYEEKKQIETYLDYSLF